MDPELQQLLAHIAYDIQRGYSRDQIVNAVTERVRGVSRTRVRELIPAARSALRASQRFNDCDPQTTLEDCISPLVERGGTAVVRVLTQFVDQHGSIIYQSFDIEADWQDTKQDVLDAVRQLAEIRAIDYNWTYQEDLTAAEGPLI